MVYLACDCSGCRAETSDCVFAGTTTNYPTESVLRCVEDCAVDGISLTRLATEKEILKAKLAGNIIYDS